MMLVSSHLDYYEGNETITVKEKLKRYSIFKTKNYSYNSIYDTLWIDGKWKYKYVCVDNFLLRLEHCSYGFHKVELLDKPDGIQSTVYGNLLVSQNVFMHKKVNDFKNYHDIYENIMPELLSLNIDNYEGFDQKLNIRLLAGQGIWY